MLRALPDCAQAFSIRSQTEREFINVNLKINVSNRLCSVKLKEFLVNRFIDLILLSALVTLIFVEACTTFLVHIAILDLLIFSPEET